MVYVTRTWSPLPKTASESSESYLTIYDSGGFIGELFESKTEPYFQKWKCWEILKRESNDGQIIEELRLMPEDWVPFNVISCERYPIVLNENGYTLDSKWLIKDLQKEEVEEPVQVHVQQEQALLPRQQVQRPQEHLKQMRTSQKARQVQQGSKPSQRSKTDTQTIYAEQPLQILSDPSRARQRERYPKQWEEPVAQTWTPLAQIVQETATASKKSEQRLKQDPSYRRQKDVRSHLPSKKQVQPPSKLHRNQTSHQPNTPS